ncbi:MAG: site-specific DNA-methyltransferase [Pyrinomonadaceae bacterium]|nr:site-specific DNA-methyltransferase [Pyrinomonadaceae bacterium]
MKGRQQKGRAPRNRTITVSASEKRRLRRFVLPLKQLPEESAENRIVCGDSVSALKMLPPDSVDLVFSDPPYNLTKAFGKIAFKQTSLERYEEKLEEWLEPLLPLLKENASIYLCGDWRSASAIQRVGMRYFKLRNRITWEREKGRGSKTNWKNAAEDIWFFTVSDNYTFNETDVRLKKRVIAPYKENGKPKDWKAEKKGNFRLTSPSNLWTDISVPFWSMPENTEHPTQKPEKLVAKLVLASSNPGDLVLDPFAGSGTAPVVASKLDRKYIGIESDENYCLIAQKRLEMAVENPSIQGFSDGVFWERNSKK